MAKTSRADTMNETDVKDKRGNIVISPGLKVRHKKSQFEYTVNSVIKEPDGAITVLLQSPESARFDPPEEEKIISDQADDIDILYETEPVEDISGLYFVPNEDDVQEDDLLAVDAEEFEKEYEIK